ncbi:MAG: hypothetical protein NVSMB32_06290 [Actinomycetota bacterium]
MHVRKTLGLLALALIAAGCNSGTNRAGSPAPNATPSGPAGTTVDVVMKDLSFTPDHLSVRRGDVVTLRFSNSGAVLHEAVIGDEATQGQAETAMHEGGHPGMHSMNAVQVKPGEKGQLTFTFDKPGEVVIGCHQPGHYGAGMRVTVTVST